MNKNQVTQILSSVITLIKAYRTFSLGDLICLTQFAEKQPAILEQKTLSSALVDFIFEIYEHGKKKENNSEKMGLLAIESIVYNIYKHCSNSKLGNSIYNNSLLMSSFSQLSMNDQETISNPNENQAEGISSVGIFLEDFISEPKANKRLKVISQRCSQNGENYNQRYVQILMETIQYILQKEGRIEKDKGQFYEKKKSIVSSSVGQHRNLKKIIETVNEIIFSRKLNRIFCLLTTANESIYFSLLRIYLCQIQQNGSESQERQKSQKFYHYFRKKKFHGNQMLYNICFNYVQSIQDSNELFEASMHPFYKLISNYLLCFFASSLREFTHIILKCCKIDYKNQIEFYKLNERIISKQLVQFIEFLPEQLTKYLNLLYRISCVCQRSQKPISFDLSIKKDSPAITPLTAVKKLFLYSFLVKIDFIQLYLPKSLSLHKCVEVCNNLLNLFFQSSLKQYESENLLEEQYQLMSSLVTTVSTTIDQRILVQNRQNDFIYHNDFSPISMNNYFIEEPLLNCDYQILYEWITEIEFTPKDEKDFDMKSVKLIEELYEEQVGQELKIKSSEQLKGYDPHALSPMHNFKKDTEVESLRMCQSPGIDENQIDFLTWMSVGGTKNYDEAFTSTQSFKDRATNRNQQKKPKKKYITFPQQNIKQIKKFYTEYHKIIDEHC